MKSHVRSFIFGLMGVTVAILIVLFSIYGGNTVQVLSKLVSYTSQLLTGSIGFGAVEGGFVVNVSISIFSMFIAILLGCLIGVGMVSSRKYLSVVSTLVMNVLRNSPWLVILYAMLYLLPYQVEFMGRAYQFSPFIKAMIGLSLPVMANMAEILRGSIESIHVGQWESARALGYRPLQVLRWIIVPQAIPRMIPNVMNLYAMLFIGSSLIVVTGTVDVLSVAKTIIATQGEEMAAALYIYVLYMFFVYCYPIATLSRWYERKVLESLQ